MGYDQVTLGYTVHARVSRHNSSKDDEHDQLWEELRKRAEKALEEIVNDPKYKPIDPFLA